MPRIYRTAQGRYVNMDQLVLMNEKAPAIGNMKVNAIGDEIAPNGTVLKTREQRLQEFYTSISDQSKYDNNN